MKKIAIIGGGIGGIATAALLAKAGYSVDVYEKNEQLGGRAGRMDVDEFRFDTGPSWYLMPEVFEQYYSLLDTCAKEQLDLVKLSPSYKVFFEDSSDVTITADLEKDAQTFDAIEPGAGDQLKKYVQYGQRLYDLSMKHFLYTNFEKPQQLVTPEVYRQANFLLPYISMSVHQYVSRFFKNPKLQKIIEYPMVFLGTSPFSAPALYSLMSALDFKQGVYYPQGGMYTIIQSLVTLAEKYGVQFHTNAPCDAILTHDGSASGVRVNGQDMPADIVVSNADIHFTETSLLPSQYQTYPEKYWNKKNPGISAFIVYLGVKGELPDITHHSLLFVDEWQKNFEDIYRHKAVPDPASIYLCNPSKLDPSTAPTGHENIFVLVPFPVDSPVDDAKRDELYDLYMKQIERMIGVDDLRKRVVTKEFFTPDEFKNKFNSWRNTALGSAHILRQSALFRTKNYSKKLKNLYYVGGNTIPGIGLPMCLIGSELVYKRIHGINRAGPLNPDDVTKDGSV